MTSGDDYVVPIDSVPMEVPSAIPALNTDELIDLMKADEIADAESPLITPVNYARIRPFINSPQIIFYHIRAGHLNVYLCPCGNRCINKKEADEYFKSKGKTDGKTAT